MRVTRFLITAMGISVAACATLTPVGRIEQRLRTLGLSEPSARCFAHGLDQRLDDKDLAGVARFLDTLRPHGGEGATIKSLSGVDNPRAASAIAATALSCAFGSKS